MTVLGPNGRPVGNRASRVQQWEGTLPFNGDYRIQLRPVQGLSESDYNLALTLTESAEEPEPSPSPSASPSPKYDAQAVNLPAGQSVEVAGKTSPKLVKRYLVTVPQGQVMTVKPIEGDVRIDVQYPNGGQVEKNAAGVKFVLPGEYRVDAIAADQADFRLNISLQNSPQKNTQ
jgi:serine/threonine-protein kinase